MISPKLYCSFDTRNLWSYQSNYYLRYLSLCYYFNYIVLLPWQLSYLIIVCFLWIDQSSTAQLAVCTRYQLRVAMRFVSSPPIRMLCARAYAAFFNPLNPKPACRPSFRLAMPARSHLASRPSVRRPSPCASLAQDLSLSSLHWLPNITVPTLLLRRRSLQFIRQHAIAFIYNSITPN